MKNELLDKGIILPSGEIGKNKDHLRSVLQDQFDEAHLLVKEYTCTFPKGISDDEYLLRIRK